MKYLAKPAPLTNLISYGILGYIKSLEEDIIEVGTINGIQQIYGLNQYPRPIYTKTLPDIPDEKRLDIYIEAPITTHRIEGEPISADINILLINAMEAQAADAGKFSIMEYMAEYIQQALSKMPLYRTPLLKYFPDKTYEEEYNFYIISVPSIDRDGDWGLAPTGVKTGVNVGWLRIAATVITSQYYTK